MSKIIINQPAMLGDLLFIEPIVRNLLQKDHEVFWPIKDQYFWIKNYIKHHGLRIVKQSEFNLDYEHFGFNKMGEYDYIPLRFSTPLFRGDKNPHSGANHEHFMLDKYRIMGLPLDMWRDLKWERNLGKENELYAKLGLKEDSKYTLINKFMKDCFDVQPELDKLKPDGLVIQMRNLEGYTMLDWTKVIINASEVHTVETALIYIMEVLPLKAKEIHMYSRSPWQDTLGGVKNFISDKWIRHETFR